MNVHLFKIFHPTISWFRLFDDFGYCSQFNSTRNTSLVEIPAPVSSTFNWTEWAWYSTFSSFYRFNFQAHICHPGYQHPLLGIRQLVTPKFSDVRQPFTSKLLRRINYLQEKINRSLSSFQRTHPSRTTSFPLKQIQSKFLWVTIATSPTISTPFVIQLCTLHTAYTAHSTAQPTVLFEGYYQPIRKTGPLGMKEGRDKHSVAKSAARTVPLTGQSNPDQDHSLSLAHKSMETGFWEVRSPIYVFLDWYLGQALSDYHLDQASSRTAFLETLDLR